MDDLQNLAGGNRWKFLFKGKNFITNLKYSKYYRLFYMLSDIENRNTNPYLVFKTNFMEYYSDFWLFLVLYFCILLLLIILLIYYWYFCIRSPKM